MTRHSFLAAVAITLALMCADGIRADEDARYSDASVRQMVERIEEAFPDAKKRESDELTLGAWEFVPGKRGMTRKQLFAKIGVEEKRLGRPNRGFFNDLKFATWQLSHSYSISIAYTVVSPVQDADSDDEVIAVYTVVIIKADKDSVFGP